MLTTLMTKYLIFILLTALQIPTSLERIVSLQTCKRSRHCQFIILCQKDSLVMTLRYSCSIMSSDISYMIVVLHAWNMHVHMICIVLWDMSISLHSFALFVSVRLQLTSRPHEYMIDGLSRHPCIACKSDALDSPLENLPLNSVSTAASFSHLTSWLTSD